MNAWRKFNCSAPTAAFFRENRTRVIQRLLSTGVVPSESFILLCGPVMQSIYDDDMEFAVAPENTFYQLMGICEPDTYGLIDVQSNFATLFVDFPDPMKAYWANHRSRDHYLTTGKFDEVLGLDAFKNTLQLRVGAKKLFLFAGKNPLSGLDAGVVGAARAKLDPMLEGCDVDSTKIFEHLCEERVRKSPEELRLLKQSVELAVLGHIEMMKEMDGGLSELQLAHRFEFVLKYIANAETSFEIVVAAGPNAQFSKHTPSTLNTLLEGQAVVLNAGARLFGYCSDIARTLPVGRAFTTRQRQIYEVVLKAQENLLAIVRPGMTWKEINHQTELQVLKGLLSLGILRGELKTLDTKRVAYFFFPQAIGGYIGLYKDDLPGLNELEKDCDPLRRCELKITCTVEKDMSFAAGVGVYFNDQLLKEAMNDADIAQHLNSELIKEFQAEISGVYLKDQLIVTMEGCEVLSGGLPRKVDEVEIFRQKIRSARFENS